MESAGRAHCRDVSAHRSYDGSIRQNEGPFIADGEGEVEVDCGWFVPIAVECSGPALSGTKPLAVGRHDLVRPVKSAGLPISSFKAYVTSSLMLKDPHVRGPNRHASPDGTIRSFRRLSSSHRCSGGRSQPIRMCWAGILGQARVLCQTRI